MTFSFQHFQFHAIAESHANLTLVIIITVHNNEIEMKLVTSLFECMTLCHTILLQEKKM